MARRVAIGSMLDGTFDLRCSLPGFDALTIDIDDPLKCSFSSQWTDVMTVHQIGNVAVLDGPLHNPQSPAGTIVHFPDLPQIPYVEIRPANGNNVFDDRQSDNGSTIAVSVKIDRWQLARLAGSLPNAFYVIFKEGSAIA
jgi:hypothetical protein